MSKVEAPQRAPWAIPAEALEEWRRLAVVLAERGPAPCEEGDHEAWWPSGGGSPDQLAVRACERCPAKAECLDYAVKADEREGLWGGLTRDERRDLRRHLGEESPPRDLIPQSEEERRRAHAKRIADWRARRRYAETTKSA